MKSFSSYKTSTGLYRSCAALACFSGTFDLILYEAVILNLWLRRFGLVKFGLDQPCFALVEFGFVWFGGSTDKQTNNNYLILINLICEFVFGYSTDKQTN